ncbi:MAG TPA: RNA polymerase sigma factor [Actinomycetota bacterium]|jgi:RNA polymerase sigma-70 factor (ECF subfamily)
MKSEALDEVARATLEAAYRELGADLWRSVYAFGGGSREIADDAVTLAFIEAGPRLGSIRNLKAWLYTVAFRAAADELRRRSRSTSAPDEAEHVEGTAAAGLDSGFDVDLAELVERLSPRQRGAFVLRDVMGYSGREAAELLGTSEGAVRVHLHAARRRLRSQLEEVERT